MEIELTDYYENSGFVARGNLAVVKYLDYAKTLPNHGKFGGMSFYDGLEKARGLMKKQYPDAIELLEIPELVCRVGG